MTLEQAWQRQIAWCDANGSPFTARVLEAAWADRLPQLLRFLLS